MISYKYFLFNKPSKTVSTIKYILNYINVKNRTSLFNKYDLNIIGRLDYYSSGILLITNDGILSNKLIHPCLKIHKTYIVKIKGIPSNKTISFIKNRNSCVVKIKNIGITKKKTHGLN